VEPPTRTPVRQMKRGGNLEERKLLFLFTRFTTSRLLVAIVSTFHSSASTTLPFRSIRPMNERCALGGGRGRKSRLTASDSSHGVVRRRPIRRHLGCSTWCTCSRPFHNFLPPPHLIRSILAGRERNKWLNALTSRPKSLTNEKFIFVT
jgi:hypothetical protein